MADWATVVLAALGVAQVVLLAYIQRHLRPKVEVVATGAELESEEC